MVRLNTYDTVPAEWTSEQTVRHGGPSRLTRKTCMSVLVVQMWPLLSGMTGHINNRPDHKFVHGTCRRKRRVAML